MVALPMNARWTQPSTPDRRASGRMMSVAGTARCGSCTLHLFARVAPPDGRHGDQRLTFMPRCLEGPNRVTDGRWDVYVVADSDTRWKWGAALARRLVPVRRPRPRLCCKAATPSDRQLRWRDAGLAGSGSDR